MFGQGADPTRHWKETAVNRAVAIAAKVPTLNVHRAGMLVLNTGFWTLIILAGRALYA
jgi:hypothetical protein